MSELDSSVSNEPVVSKKRAWFVLFTITSILFLTFLDTTIMSVAAVNLQETLQTSVSDLQWIINAYALLFAALMLAFGTLGDRVGRKKVMLGGLAVFAAGSLFGALAWSIPSLIAARALMGVGAAACEPGTLSVIRQIYPDRKDRARAIGLWAAMAGLALAMGPVIGGVLVWLGGWPAIFWFNLAASIAVIAAAIPLVTESADPEKGKTDYVGYVLGPVALGLLVFAIIRGETLGYFSWQVLTMFGAGAIAMTLFVLWELRAEAPMLEMKYFRRPPFSGSLTVAFATYFGVFSIFFLTAIYLQVVAHYSALRLAVLFVPMAACLIISSLIAGRWVAGSGAHAPVTLGCLCAGLGVWLTNMALGGGDTHFTFLLLTLALSGVGFGIAVVPITTVALSALPSKHSGMAASATTTTREVGTVLGVAVLGSLFNNRLLTFLSARLQEYGWPEGQQQTIIDGVLTGQIPGYLAEYQPVIDKPTMETVNALFPDPSAPQREIAEGIVKATQAAFDAVGNGVSWSLWVAGGIILASGVVAFFTFPRTA